MSEENRRSNVLAVTLVVAVTFQIFLSVLILNELRALPGKMPVAGPAAAQARGLDAGTEAPAFTLVVDQGKEVSLADFANRKVMLIFSSDSCKFCKQMYPELKRLRTSGEYSDVEVVMLQLGSTPEKNRGLKLAQGFDFPVLAAGEQVLSAYKVPGTPVSTIVSESGVVAVGGNAGNYEAMAGLLNSVDDAN